MKPERVMLLFAAILLAGLPAFAGPGYFTYEGYLTDSTPAAQPITDPALPMVFKIIGTDGTNECVLATSGTPSIPSVDIPVDNGSFIARIGSAAVPMTVHQGKPFNDVFNGGVTGGLHLNGTAGCSLSITNAKRFLQITVDSDIFQNIEISSAPMAMTADRADQVGKFKPEHLLRVEDSGVPQTISPLGSAQWNSLLDIVAGTSSAYLKPGDGIDWSAVSGKPSVFPPDAHGHYYSDLQNKAGAYLNYKPNDVACAAGEVLKWDASGRWECGTDAGAAGMVASVAVSAPLVNSGTASAVNLSITDASTSAKGIVKLATDGDNAAGVAVQGNDSRLSNARAPSGAAGGDLAGSYPNPSIANSAVTDTKISDVSVSKITSSTSAYFNYKPNNVACGANQTLKWISDRWECANDLGAAETDPTVAGFAKNVPSSDFSTPTNVLTLNTVDVSKGGTGLTALGSANQVLSVNTAGTAMEYRTLAAGSGVTITPSVGTLTIAATGSESTNVSNIGASGVGVFKQMNGTQVELKNINAASTAVTVTNDTTNNEVDIGVNAELSGLSLLSTNGFVKRTGAGTYSSSSLSLTTDVNGVLPVANGGTGLSSIGNFMVMGTNSSGAVTPVAGTVNGSILQYSATGPIYSTASYPTTTTANQLLYSSANNVIGGLATANNSVLTTNASGIPSFRTLAATDIPNLDATKITTGTFTPARLGSGTANGSTYLRGDGTWVTVPSGTVSSVGTGTGLTGGTITSSGTISLANTSVTPGGYGSANSVGTFTVDAQGRLTAASSISIGSLDTSVLTTGTLAAARMPAFTGDITTSAGTIATSLSTTGVSAGTYKSVTVDAKGRVTAGANPTTIAGYGITDAVLNGGNTGAVTVGTNNTASLTLKTNNSPTLTILAGGNVGIGKTTPAAKLDVQGEVRTTDSSGNNRLWGKGRPGTARYGTGGIENNLCSNGSIKFGLSKHIATWHAADQVCPQGTWVCTASERGYGNCNTTRPRGTDTYGGSCDGLTSSGTCITFTTSNQEGWLADVGAPSTTTALYFGLLQYETTDGFNYIRVMTQSISVWCCSE